MNILVALQIFGLFGVVISVPTCLQVRDMTRVIADATKAQQGLLPLLVRLGFHDCVGGCNGCINFNNPDNNGLKPAVDNLTQMYISNGYKNIGVSLADYFAFAATVGVTIAVQGSNRERNGGVSCTPLSCPGPCPIPCFNLTWGRKDVTNCNTTEPNLPSPTMTSAKMFDYFNSTFGFNKQQVVTLMGAHSLGGAKRENSGYAGKWTGPQNPGFNELFYLNLINATNTWTNRNVAPPTSVPKWEFQGRLADGSDAGFMLNTDVELFYDLTLDPTTARATCQLNPTCGVNSPNTCGGSCPIASTFAQAASYSKNCPLFMADFVNVFQLMLNNGYLASSLQSTKCCPP